MTMDDEREFWTTSRFISALVVLAYMPLGFVLSGGEGALSLLAFCLFPIMCIWFPEFMGNYRGLGLAFPRVITHRSPAVIVFILGWVVLALPLVVLFLRYFYS